MPAPPPVPTPRSLGARAWNLATRAHVTLYRRTGGRLGHSIPRVMPQVLLLDHLGRKSGTRRTTPLLYVEDGDDLVLAGSRGGSDSPPAWWLNLNEHPETEVQVRDERRRVVARTASPEEKRRLWPKLVDLYPNFDEYQKRTDRDIPVVILSRAEAGGTGQGATRARARAGQG